MYILISVPAKNLVFCLSLLVNSSISISPNIVYSAVRISRLVRIFKGAILYYVERFSYNLLNFFHLTVPLSLVVLVQF